MAESWLLHGEPVTNTVLYVNGEYVRKMDAKISVYDSGFQHGDAVYEGIRVYNNRIFMLEEHIQRLYESCKSLDITVGKSPDQLMEIVKETVRRNLALGIQDLHIRLQVTRGLKALTGMNPKMNIGPSSIVLCVDEKKPIFSKSGVKLVTSILKRYSPQYLDAKIHDCNQLNQIMAAIEANRQGADEAIMLDERGFVSETNSCTLVMVKEQTVLFPTVDYILPGITRRILMQAAAGRGLRVDVRNLSLHEFYNADEVFLCGTVGEIVPVAQIDGRSIGRVIPGPITKLLSEDYDRLTQEQGVPLC